LEAARKQKLYLEVLEVIYLNQDKWAAQTNDPAEAVEKEKELIKIVSSVPKISISLIKRDMKNNSIDKLIEIDKKEGSALGVNTSPTLFVDYKIINPLSLDVMIQRIDSALNKN
jgi:protein-disulfide isomerase